ncbi:MAG: DUF4838 domain-containing protein [Lentisphaeria bacterium]|nr:DUF4838 domain-containing protein [Lentisphaeria bacterium]
MNRIKSMTLALAMLASAGLSAFELGKPCTIYFGNKCWPAAQELSETLEQIYGEKFPVQPAGKMNRGIFVGVKKGDKMVCSSVKGDRLDIYGTNIKYAVADFLERECGVRYLWPGKLGTVIPDGSVRTLPNGEYSFQPQFSIRLSQSFHYPTRYMNLPDRKDLSIWLQHRKIGQELRASFGHAFARLVPREKYGKTHPEYFSLITPANWTGGVKPEKPRRANSDTGVWQLCTSNPEVRQIIAEQLAANARKHPEIVQSISPNDGAGFCECDQCKAEDEPIQTAAGARLTNRMYKFMADVARRAQKIYPGTRVGMFSYSYFSGVPTNGVKLPDNCYLSLCYIQVEAITPEKQKELDDKIIGLGKTGAKIVGREYWGTHYYQNMPIQHSTLIEHNIKLLSKYNAAGIYGEPSNAFSIRATDNYVLAKLAWDPRLSRDAILHDFCNAAFGQAADVMYRYFDEEEKIFLKKWKEASNRDYPMMAYAPSMYANRLRMLSSIFDEQWQKNALAQLRKAKSLAKKTVEKERIDFFIAGVNVAYAKSRLNEYWSECAAGGLVLPLIQPAEIKVRMEKNNLRKLFAGASRAALNYETLMAGNIVGNAQPGIGFLREYALSLRPWKTVTEKALLDLSSNRFNYLVNGCFEYRQWEWEIKGDKDLKYSFTTERNCDNKENFMAQCHLNQGMSLKLEIPAETSVTITSKRPVETDIPAFLRGTLFTWGDAKVTADFNGRKLRTFHVNAGLEENGWKELRFTPLPVEPGKYIFQVTVTNPSDQTQIVYLDDLEVQIKPQPAK